jgi:TPR repeat protein
MGGSLYKSPNIFAANEISDLKIINYLWRFHMKSIIKTFVKLRNKAGIIFLISCLLIFPFSISFSLDSPKELKKADALRENKQYSKAFNIYKSLADKGNPEAQYEVGRMYLFGQGIGRDSQEAFKWLEKAGQQGDADIKFKIAVMYSLERNFQEAIKWYKKAAQQGDSKSSSMLGFMYYRGEFVRQDSQEALKWLKKAAEQDPSDMMSHFTALRQNAEIGHPDAIHFLNWLHKAAGQGNADAIYLLRRFF